MNGPLWLAALVFAPSISIAIFYEGVERWFLMFVGFLVVANAIFNNWYYNIKDPDRLQSDERQIEKLRLEHSYLQAGKPEVFAENNDGILSPVLEVEAISEQPNE